MIFTVSELILASLKDENTGHKVHDGGTTDNANALFSFRRNLCVFFVRFVVTCI